MRTVSWVAVRVATCAATLTVLTETGETFPQWRTRLRMDVARELLCFGEAPAQLSRRLGYAHPAAFTRAFTTVYGMSPREYQHREHHRAPTPRSSGQE